MHLVLRPDVTPARATKPVREQAKRRSEGIVWFVVLAYALAWTWCVPLVVTGATVEQVEAEANRAMVEIRDARAGQWHSFGASHFVFRAYPGIGLDPETRIYAHDRRGRRVLVGGPIPKWAFPTGPLAWVAVP